RCWLFSLWRSWNWLRGGLRRCNSVSAFTVLKEDCDWRIDLYTFSAGSNEELANDAFVNSFNFHCCFVGFNFRDHVAGNNLIAFLLNPVGEGALFHGWGKRWHENFYRH